MPVLCSGSVAVDHIMVFQGRFKEVILPDKIHMLNVAFHVPDLRRTYGGCAANIAFNLRLLGVDPIIAATVGGDDFGAYADWLDEHGLRRDGILPLAGESTAGAYITTDLDDNQIVGFHPGAMDRAHEVDLGAISDGIRIGIVSPNGKRAMVEHTRALAKRGVKLVVDPGQGLPILEGAELREMIEAADVYIVNDYEWELTKERSGLSEEEIEAKAGAVVVTRGDRGSELRVGGERSQVPVVEAEEIVDPTGCGDAYRAGLVYGLLNEHPLEVCARIGSILGSLQVACRGTQGLRTDLDAVRARYRHEFDSTL